MNQNVNQQVSQAVKKSMYQISINYPTSASNSSRWGYSCAPHPILTQLLENKRESYESLLKQFLEASQLYANIPIQADPDDPTRPCLKNPWLPGLDSFALYSMIGICKPKRYIEVGSGYSTKFARQAIKDYKLDTKLISIDPQPRAEIDALCDVVIRQPVEMVDLETFDSLEANDILFIDNSHRSFLNSDVTITFLDIIPRLNQGVLVEIHDIFLPFDYPPHWVERYYNEQYLLAAYLLAEGTRFEIVLPNAFISKDSSLQKMMKPLFSTLNGVSSGGGSFWIRTGSSQFGNNPVQLVEVNRRLKKQIENKKTKLDKFQVRIDRLNQLLEEKSAEIQSMKSSKFWKIRSLWFKLKRSLGMNIE